jgi:hypothetical protein
MTSPFYFSQLSDFRSDDFCTKSNTAAIMAPAIMGTAIKWGIELAKSATGTPETAATTPATHQMRLVLFIKYLRL